MTYIVFDDDGVIHESNDEDAAQSEYDSTTDFKGDLRFVKLIDRRR